MRRLVLLGWLACVAPTTPAAAHGPFAGAAGVEVPVQAPGGQPVRVWLPVGVVAGETRVHACGHAAAPAPTGAADTSAAAPRGRRWHVGDASRPLSRYRVVPRAGSTSSGTE
jgi:hypothetical protein